MKKQWMALALAALLTLSCGLALAEAQTYDLYQVSDKAMLTLTIDRDPLYITLDEAFDEMDANRVTVEADDLAPCVISVAKSDITEDMSLSDLTTEDLEELKTILAEQFETPEVISGTENGITYIVIKTCADASDVHSVMTIKDGYFVQIDQYQEDFSLLSEADEAFAREVFAGLNVRLAE